MQKPDIARQSFIIVIHENAPGPGHDLRDYLLKQNVQKLLFIAHPLLNDRRNAKNPSRFELYRNGRCIRKERTRFVPSIPLISYLKDVPQTLYWGLQFGSYEYYVGLDPWNTISGLLLRLFG